MRFNAAPPHRCEFVREIVAPIFRNHVPLFALVIVYGAAATLFRLYFSDTPTPEASVYFSLFGFMSILFGLTFILGYPFYVMVFQRPDNLVVHLRDGLRYRYLTFERLLNGVAVLAVTPIFMWSFSSFENLIPAINPFGWDEFLAMADRTLHGGQDAWVLLDPLLGYPLITSAINFFYNLWFFVLFGILFWQAFSLKDKALRLQFFITFMLLWIIMGTVLAAMMSSVGPVYYARVTGLGDIYAPLIGYLYGVRETLPVWSLSTQEMLWSAYENGESGLVSGISTMPSMHVATTVLFALLGWRHHRLLGWALTMFAILIMLGSVHLGWHYALDGYLAIPIVWAIWRLSGRYASSREAD